MKKLIVLCMLFLTQNLFAAAATVLFTSGKVTGSGGSTISRGASLSAGDSVATGDASAANIKYGNGTLVNLGANTNYKILEYSPKQAETQIKSELSQGNMNSKSAGKTKETVKTPVVALAVLGTAFELSVNCEKYASLKDRKKCKRKVNVHVIEGKVQVGNQMVNPGQSVAATASGVRPAPFPPSAQVNTPAGAPGSTNITTSTSTTIPPTTYTNAVAITTNQTTNTSTTTVTPGTSTTIVPIPPSPPPCPPNCGPLLPMPIPMIH